MHIVHFGSSISLFLVPLALQSIVDKGEIGHYFLEEQSFLHWVLPQLRILVAVIAQPSFYIDISFVLLLVHLTVTVNYFSYRLFIRLV